SDKEIWDYVNQFAGFNRYTNSPVANYKGEIYNLPFNMNTFNKLWGVVTPAEAQAKIEEQRAILNGKTPENLEEQAISLVGTDIYEKLIKDYTEKQWGKPTTEQQYLKDFPKIVFTGMIDEFFDYKLGELEYRSLRFENETLDMENYQGNAVVNYTDAETPYTRIIEHKHFEFGSQAKTIIT
ncbi:UDP-galactopyranose mutase, partial [Streptococcus pneumoniae]|uniref:UDP-galactopyranose mutase n=1 Tax=Streptococcus pneumoniae TaxID=1313 RepID=UPI00298E175C